MVETCTLYEGVEVYKPMLVLKTPDNASELIASKKYIAQPKKDGYFYQLVKTKGGEIYLFSRSKSKKTNFYSEKIDNTPHIKEWAEQLPNDTILIGEIYYPGKTSKDTTTIMGCLPEKAIIRQKGKYGWIHYYIHDILRYAGYDYVQNEIDFEHRYSNLCSNIDLCDNNPNFIEIAYSKTGYDMEECIYNWMENGEEGAVVRLKSGLYLPGKRRKDMFKIKQHEDSLDFVIMDILDPEYYYTGIEADNWQYKNEKDELITKAAFYGWKNAFQLGLYDKDKLIPIGRVASGFTDELRADCVAHPEKYLGSVCEIQCMSLDKKEKSFRHPVLIKVRDDKPAQDCTVESVFG